MGTVQGSIFFEFVIVFLNKYSEHFQIYYKRFKQYATYYFSPTNLQKKIILKAEKYENYFYTQYYKLHFTIFFS